jgi:hypothetical protein
MKRRNDTETHPRQRVAEASDTHVSANAATLTRVKAEFRPKGIDASGLRAAKHEPRICIWLEIGIDLRQEQEETTFDLTCLTSESISRNQ